MKRFLFTSVLLMAVGQAAFGFENNANITVPPMSYQLIQIDDPVFVNNGVFNVTVTRYLGDYTVLYETSSTLDYTNNGAMTSSAGFDFETFPASTGQRHWANSFVNNGNGFGGGTITAIGLFGGNVFAQGGVAGGAPRQPLNFEVSGLGSIIVHATNVVNTGLLTTDNTGLIDIVGNSLDMRRGQLVMTGNPTPESQGYGIGGTGTNTALWQAATALRTNRAASPVFTNSLGNRMQLSLNPSEAYLEDTNPAPDQNNVVIWRAVFIQDLSPTNVTHSVSFNEGGDFAVQWTGNFRNARTGGTDTSYFFLSDDPTVRRAVLNPFQVTANIPDEFTFQQSATPFFFGPPATQSFVTNPFPAIATNDFAYVSIVPQGLSMTTNQVIGGSPTNLPGRIQLTSLGSLDLADTTISGANYLKIDAPTNFVGNSNSAISAAYVDLNLGSPSGSLVVSNLISPVLPIWTVAGGGGGGGGIAAGGTGIEAFSGSYLFVSSNTPAGSTNTITVTNDVRILLVRSRLSPTTTTSQKDIVLHAPNSVVIGDAYKIFGNFFSDTKSLTISTNDTNAYSPAGSLLLTSPNLLWSASLPNLQYFTNWGTVSTINRANFAGNLPGLLSPLSQAIPYKAFVNHGSITSGGAFVAADYFENSGNLIESPSGDITLSISGAALNTGGILQAPESPITITANSLLISNSIVAADRALTITTPCFLSDGYAFGNQFGHPTNASLPNVVTNGNTFTTGGGIKLLAKPGSGDLLGTTIFDVAASGLLSVNVWPAEDRGASPAGFAENLAVGQLVLSADPSPSRFVFQGLNNDNAIYVDSLILLDNAANADANGNYPAITIQPGMKIYYAQALANGVSIAEKLNGKNGGGFCWVSNYAGVYSSINVGGTLYNQALAASTNIDSDGDSIANGTDTTPFPAGWTFDVSNPGPTPCGGGGIGGGGGSGGTGGTTGTGGSVVHGTLAFPVQPQSGSGSVSFLLAQGTYNGLFYDTNGVNPLSAGSFTAKLNRQGTFSGKLQLGTSSYSFVKSFDASGNLATSISGKNLPTLTLTLQLVNNDEIIGQVSGDNWTAQLLAFSELDNAFSFGIGKHTLVLSTDAGNSTAASGDSYGTLTLSKNGNIQWTGVLPDGGKVSQKSALSKDGVWPLYSSLYGGNGALIGWLQLSNHSSDIGGSAIWVVPANQNALYPNGLTNELDASGSDIKSSAGASQKTLILSGPGLTAPLTNSVTITGKTAQSANNTLSLLVDVKNGLFSGSVVDPGSNQKLSFQGALLEKSGVGGGFFLNASKDLGGKAYLAPAN